MAKEKNEEKEIEIHRPRLGRFREMTNIERELNELRRNMLAWMSAPFGWIQPREVVRMPEVDIIDRGKEFVVEADLPGVSKDDVEINITEDEVEISAEKKTERREEEEGYISHERTYRGYYRAIPLPDEINPDQADAEMKNGMLKVTLPKRTPTKVEGRKLRPK
jgi:HSP20 family protein